MYRHGSAGMMLAVFLVVQAFGARANGNSGGSPADIIAYTLLDQAGAKLEAMAQPTTKSAAG